jgi:hypothetical protein
MRSKPLMHQHSNPPEARLAPSRLNSHTEKPGTTGGAQPCGKWVSSRMTMQTAQTTPSDISALEGDGSAPPRIEGEQGADLHGSASCNGCACHTAGPAQGRRLQAVNKFAHYLECVRGDTPLGRLPEYLAEGAVRDARHRACLSRFRCSSHDFFFWKGQLHWRRLPMSPD